MTSVADMKATVVRPAELGAAEEHLWSALTDRSSLANPFLSWPFIQVVGRVREDARVAVFEDGGVVIGFLGFQLGRDGAGRPLGATISDAQAVIAPSGWDFEPRHLVRCAGLHSWSFDHLTLEQSAFAPYHNRRHRCPVVDLAAGHEAFIQGVRTHSKDLLSQVARRRRKLEREVGPVTFEWHSSDAQADMRTLRRWKSAQYRRDQTWDRFAEPWIVDAVASLAGSVDPSCVGVLSALRAGDKLASVHLGLLGHDRLSWWFPAYNPAFARYSPGLILLLELIPEAIRQGVPLLDLGRGEHDYKLRVASHFYEVAEGEVVAEGT